MMRTGATLPAGFFAVLLGVLVPATGPALAAGPTFDCNKADLNETERTICSSPALSQLDHRLANAYALVFDIDFLQNAAQLAAVRDSVRQRERAWLRERDTCGTADDCIANAYHQQISYLTSILPDDVLPADGGATSSASTTVFPAPGTSGGGVVRDGPGISYSRIGSLKAGDDISLLSNAGEVMNGYPWFEIQTLDGTIGYQWGGILCANTTPVSGAWETCTPQDCPCEDN